MAEIGILQLGMTDWNEVYIMPDNVVLDHTDVLEKPLQKPYDMFFLDRTPTDKEIELLYPAVKAYTLFVTRNVEVEGQTGWRRGS